MNVVPVVGVPPEGYTVRAPRQDDLVSVTGLIGAAERADLGSSFYSSDLVAEDWSLPGFDLASDAWLAIHFDGQLAGYGWVHRPTAQAPFFGQATVHPAHRGRGIGAVLLGLRERRARELSPPGQTSLLTTVVPGPDAAGHRLAERQGYRFARTFWHLAVKLPAPNHGRAHPTEVDIRQFARGRDERLVHEVFEEAFTGLWGFAPMAFQEWSALRIEWEGFDPSLWLVAQHGTHVVGALAGRIVDGIGWVSTLGVRPHHRGRGIGEALLRRSLLEFHRRGISEVKLVVDSANPTGATRLYERAGMHVERRYEYFEKQLDQLSPDPG